MKKTAVVLMLLMVMLFVAELAYARGRTGSRRVYPGHGKGSHYVGGR